MILNIVGALEIISVFDGILKQVWYLVLAL